MNHSPSFHPEHHPWTVEFTEPRCESQKQADALEQIGAATLYEVIRIFVKATIPDAEILEPIGTPVRTIQCARRSDARKFVATWGGRILR